MPSTKHPTHQTLDVINIMEIMVLEEVDDQLIHRISPQLARYVKRMEVATYALNRLPALYASSQEGVYYQIKRAKAQYSEQIGEAVSRGIAAVLRDPLRTSTPLTPAALSKMNVKLNRLPGGRDTLIQDRNTLIQGTANPTATAGRVEKKQNAEKKQNRPQPERREPAERVARECYGQQEQDEYKPDPRDLAYQAAQELRAALEAKPKTGRNPAFA
jgi:hypothetical protein